MSFKTKHAVSQLHLVTIAIVCSVLGVLVSVSAYNLTKGDTSQVSKNNSVQIYCAPTDSDVVIGDIKIEHVKRCSNIVSGQFTKCPVWTEDSSQ